MEAYLERSPDRWMCKQRHAPCPWWTPGLLPDSLLPSPSPGVGGPLRLEGLETTRPAAVVDVTCQALHRVLFLL